MTAATTIVHLPQVTVLDDPSRAHWSVTGAPRPIRTTLWRPGAARPAPLVLLSHGTGGAAADFGWLAERLVDAGYAATRC